jgi:hypothetical protein
VLVDQDQMVPIRYFLALLQLVVDTVVLIVPQEQRVDLAVEGHRNLVTQQAVMAQQIKAMQVAQE